MSISHWGVIPGYFAIGSVSEWGGPFPAYWVPTDFAAWCTYATREPIRVLKV